MSRLSDMSDNHLAGHMTATLRLEKTCNLHLAMVSMLVL